MKRWIETARPAKIGTMPMLVRVDGRSALEVGRWIKVQYAENGKWESVLVTKISPDGHFFADK